jgi:hypothetical protein
MSAIGHVPGWTGLVTPLRSVKHATNPLIYRPVPSAPSSATHTDCFDQAQVARRMPLSSRGPPVARARVALERLEPPYRGVCMEYHPAARGLYVATALSVNQLQSSVPLPPSCPAVLPGPRKSRQATGDRRQATGLRWLVPGSPGQRRVGCCKRRDGEAVASGQRGLQRLLRCGCAGLVHPFRL